MKTFNQGFDTMFKKGELTFGAFFPLEAYAGDTPLMQKQEMLAKHAESAGFSTLWFRDVPLRDPDFGDVGQIYDTFVYLSWIAAQTTKIALASGAIILPIRHPLHVAKAIASIDHLSGGRLVLGVASGDRPIEFPAFAEDRNLSTKRFQDHFTTLEKVLNNKYPTFNNDYGSMFGTAELVPRPQKHIPLIVTGNSKQDIEWIATHSDAWLTYARPLSSQAQFVQMWRGAVKVHSGETFKPFLQSLYLDLTADPEEKITPIHLGIRCGRTTLLAFLNACQKIGINHIAFNFKFASRPINEVIDEFSEYILPHFR